MTILVYDELLLSSPELVVPIYTPTSNIVLRTDNTLFDRGKATASIVPSYNPYINIADGKTLVGGSNISIVGTRFGRGIEWDTTSENSYIEFPNADLILDTKDCTMIIASIQSGQSATNYASNGYDPDASGGTRVINHIPYAMDSNIYWDFGNATPSSGRLNVVGDASYWVKGTYNIWGFVAGSRGREIWRNGRLIQNNTAATALRTNIGNPYRLGACYFPASPSSPRPTPDILLSFFVTKQELSHAALAYLTRNPFSVYEPV